jgi:hypothetical protein
MSRRYKPVPLKLTGHPAIDAERLAEEQAFRRGMKEARDAEKATKKWLKEQEKAARKEAKDRVVREPPLPRYKVARAFRRGHGKLS